MKQTIILLLLTGLSLMVVAEEEQKSVTEQIQDLKQEVISLNRDLFILEEDLLFPASTQVAVYVAMDVGHYFRLDAIEIKIDDKSATHYLYTERQVSALLRGGMQRLYVGNLATGEHEISAFMVGIGPQNREYRRAATLKFNKSTDAKMLQLKIVDSEQKQQPKFLIEEI